MAKEGRLKAGLARGAIDFGKGLGSTPNKGRGGSDIGSALNAAYKKMRQREDREDSMESQKAERESENLENETKRSRKKLGTPDPKNIADPNHIIKPVIGEIRKESDNTFNRVTKKIESVLKNPHFGIENDEKTLDHLELIGLSVARLQDDNEKLRNTIESNFKKLFKIAGSGGSGSGSFNFGLGETVATAGALGLAKSVARSGGLFNVLARSSGLQKIFSNLSGNTALNTNLGVHLKGTGAVNNLLRYSGNMGNNLAANGNNAGKLSAAMTKVGKIGNLARRFLTKLGKYLKIAGWVGLAALAIYELAEPIALASQGASDDLIMSSLIEAIANIAGPIIGAFIGGAAGSLVGSFLFGVGSIPGAIIGIAAGVWGGLRGGELAESFAKFLILAIMDGRDMDKAIMEWKAEQDKKKQAEYLEIKNKLEAERKRMMEYEDRPQNEFMPNPFSNQTKGGMIIPRKEPKTRKVGPSPASMGVTYGYHYDFRMQPVPPRQLNLNKIARNASGAEESNIEQASILPFYQSQPNTRPRNIIKRQQPETNNEEIETIVIDEEAVRSSREISKAASGSGIIVSKVEPKDVFEENLIDDSNQKEILSSTKAVGKIKDREIEDISSTNKEKPKKRKVFIQKRLSRAVGDVPSNLRQKKQPVIEENIPEKDRPKKEQPETRKIGGTTGVNTFTTRENRLNEDQFGNLNPTLQGKPRHRIFDGVESAMGSYLVDQRWDQMPSTYGGRFANGAGIPGGGFSNGRGGRGSGDPSSTGSGGGNTEPSRPPLPKHVQASVDRMVRGESVAGNDYLGRLSADELEALGIQKTTIRSPEDPSKFATSYRLTDPKVSSNEVMESMKVSKNEFISGLVKRGFTPKQAAVFYGNVHAESTMNPAAVNHIGAVGYMQWLGDRKAGLMEYAKSQGKDWRDPDIQMDWMKMESDGSSVKYGGSNEKKNYEAALGNSENREVAEMTEVFARKVERPHKKELEDSLPRRLREANKIHNQTGIDSEEFRKASASEKAKMFERTRQKLVEQKKVKQGEAIASILGQKEQEYIRPVDPNKMVFGDGKDQFGFRGKGNPEGVDKRLMSLFEETAKEFPLRVRFMSGKVGRNTGKHSLGKAGDITIYDDNGNALPNYQNSKTFRIYEMFGQAMYRKAQDKYPELADGKWGNEELDWGGLFGYDKNGKPKYGTGDSMDYRINTEDRTTAGSIMGGLNKAYRGALDKGSYFGGSKAFTTDEEFAKDMASLRGFKLSPDEYKELKKNGFFGVAQASGSLEPRSSVQMAANNKLPKAFEVVTQSQLDKEKGPQKAGAAAYMGGLSSTFFNTMAPHARKAKQDGASVTVTSTMMGYSKKEFEAVADKLYTDWEAGGKKGPIVVSGHSAGGKGAIRVAEMLKSKHGVKSGVVLNLVDPVAYYDFNNEIPDNVDSANVFTPDQSWQVGRIVAASDKTSVNVYRSGSGHVDAASTEIADQIISRTVNEGLGYKGPKVTENPDDKNLRKLYNAPSGPARSPEDDAKRMAEKKQIETAKAPEAKKEKQEVDKVAINDALHFPKGQEPASTTQARYNQINRNKDAEYVKGAQGIANQPTWAIGPR